MSTRSRRSPRRRPTDRGIPGAVRARPLLAAAVAVAVALAAIAAVALASRGSDDDAARPALPDASHYHSLLVDADDPNTLLLGTHDGLYRSSDGGRTWAEAGLTGDDAMHMARAGGVVWVAGHNVLERSTDGGRSWTTVRARGLGSRDIHGFAVDVDDDRTLYAAVAGHGLYRSRDGGESFARVSRSVGRNSAALGVTAGGRILVAELERGLLASDDDGRNWKRLLPRAPAGLAVNPREPRYALATERAILASSDAGESWTGVLATPAGAGPVAWSPSNPRIAYVVGFDGTLYRSRDRGQSWHSVVVP